MRRFFSFWWLCARKAFWGNTAFANDWQWVFGIPVVSGFVVWANARYGADVMSTGSAIADGFLGAFGAFAVTWTIAFAVRLMNAPVAFYHEQKDRADKLEGLRQVANDASRPPSFDIGFEYSPFDVDKEISASTGFIHHRLLRIWIENIESRPIEDCRVVIENFGPNSPIRAGAMLVPDNRGADEESSARFDLAATEKRFFKFIDMDVFPHHPRPFDIDPPRPTEYRMEIRSDQEGKGWTKFLNGDALPASERYFATIVVHGRNASSRRIDLTIDAISEWELRVSEEDSTASYRKVTV